MHGIGLSCSLNAPDLVSQLDSICRLTSFVFINLQASYVEAKRRARMDGFDDAILISSCGLVGESSAANIFVVIDGEVVTPTLQGIVSGVTRAGLLAIATQHQVSIREREVCVDELKRANEIVLVSAGVGAIAAASLLGRLLCGSLGEQMQHWLSSEF